MGEWPLFAFPWSLRHSFGCLHGRNSFCSHDHDRFQHHRGGRRLLLEAGERTIKSFANGLVLRWICPLCVNSVRLGVRDEVPQIGHHQRGLLGVHGRFSHGDWGRHVSGNAQLLRTRRSGDGHWFACFANAIRMNKPAGTRNAPRI